MGLTAKEGGGSIKLIEPGTYVARCYRVIDMGTHHDEKWDKDVHKIRIGWELPTELIESGDYAGEPYSIHTTYTLSLDSKANLRKDLEAWRGQSFTSEELKGFNVGKLIDATCFLNVVHSECGKYANVSSIMKLPKGTGCPAMVNEPLTLDLDEFDVNIFNKLSEKMQEYIAESEEYKIIYSGVPTTGEGQENVEDDDVPF